MKTKKQIIFKKTDKFKIKNSLNKDEALNKEY